MRIIISIAIIGIIVLGVVGVLVWHPWGPTPSLPIITLKVQSYQFSTSPQGLFTVTNVSYVLDGQHEIVVNMAAVHSSANITWIASDGRNWTTPGGFKVTQTLTWTEIPGWNCGYSNDNGRVETTQIGTVSDDFSLTYSCIYPPASSSVAFEGLATGLWSDGAGTTVP